MQLNKGKKKESAGNSAFGFFDDLAEEEPDHTDGVEGGVEEVGSDDSDFDDDTGDDSDGED